MSVGGAAVVGQHDGGVETCYARLGTGKTLSSGANGGCTSGDGRHGRFRSVEYCLAHRYLGRSGSLTRRRPWSLASGSAFCVPAVSIAASDQAHQPGTSSPSDGQTGHERVPARVCESTPPLGDKAAVAGVSAMPAAPESTRPSGPAGWDPRLRWELAVAAAASNQRPAALWALPALVIRARHPRGSRGVLARHQSDVVKAPIRGSR